LGFSTEIVTTTFALMSESLSKEPKVHVLRWPHHIIWTESFHRMVDPSIPHLRMLEGVIASGALTHTPVIGPLNHAHQLHDFNVVHRRAYQLSYGGPHDTPAPHVPPSLTRDRHKAVEVAAFFLALQTITSISTLNAEWLIKLKCKHPQMTDPVIPGAIHFEREAQN
jgi:hypothetical protein